MAISSKSSVASVKKETTEGTLVAATAATSFIPLQPDAAMAPNTETLTNDEIKSSIGASAPILGLEAPTFSLSHYVKHSGVEGQAPGYGPILESIFGATDTEATEYNTVASSTTSVIKVDTGEGAQFRRGQALLIKDPVNGYRIRAVESISGNDLTIGFNVPVAPGTGVNLGKAITYYPANTGHPTLSFFHYLGNPGAVQAISGARTVSASFSAEAGQLLNGTYSFEGVSYYFNPIEITSSTDTLDFDDGSARTATVAAKWYKTPNELAEALEVAMNAAGSSDTFTVTYSKTTGKFTIASDGASFELNWNTGANTAQTIGTKLGFSVAADDTGALTYTSDNALTLTAPYTPSYDAADPLAAKNQEVMIGDATDYLCFGASSISIDLAASKTNITSICAETGVSGSVVNERTVEISFAALLEQYDSSLIHKYNEGDTVKFQYSFGQKSGGNWVAGKSGCFFAPTAKVSAFSVVDQDGLVAINATLTCFVNSSGDGEFFVSFV